MASWSRAARACVQAGARSLLRPGTDAQAAARPALRDQQSRGMASGHHTEAVTYGGLTLHKPERWQSMWGEGLAGLMWFWFLVRCYHDGGTLIFGHAAHFEHEEHEEHAAHGHAEHGAGGGDADGLLAHAVPPSNTADLIAEKGS